MDALKIVCGFFLCFLDCLNAPFAYFVLKICSSHEKENTEMALKELIQTWDTTATIVLRNEIFCDSPVTW